MKTLHCSDAGFDCLGVIRAQTEEEVLQQARQHAQEAHSISVTPELEAQLRNLIKNESGPETKDK